MNRQQLIRDLEKPHLKPTVADIRVGETVKVHYKIREGNKERIQVFEGLVVATKGGQTIQGSFTVRKVVSGVGVERTFPLHSPHLVKIERVKSGKVRQARLNFVRRYALSSKFKLKDKGQPGSVWENVAEQQSAMEEAATEVATEPIVEESAEVSTESLASEVAETPETVDNNADGHTEQNTEEPSGDTGSESTAEKAADDSGSESTN